MARPDTARNECIAILALCPLLLSVALWNGFPITFFDTGAYIAQGLGHQFMVERSAGYSHFLWATGAAFSLWLVIGVQALMTAFVITETTRMEAPSLPIAALLGLGVLLTIGTGLPWYVGQIVPDCMTAVVALSLYLVSFHASRLGRLRTTMLVAVAAIATAAHSSHLGLAAGLVLFICLVKLIVRWRGGRNAAAPKAGMAALSFVLGLGIVLSSNFILTRDVFVSKVGSVFVFGRLLQDGIVKRLLDETCPASGYALCLYKDELPKTADIWLWGTKSPFQLLDRFDGTRAESIRIISDSLRLYPKMHARTALDAALSQFMMFKTGDQIEPQQWILYPDIARYVPDQLQAYMNARQQQKRFSFDVINSVHLAVGIISLCGLGLLLAWGAARRQWHAAALPAFIFIALIGNAFICGALSNPHDRYQSRVMWLPTLALVLTLWRARAPAQMEHAATTL